MAKSNSDSEVKCQKGGVIKNGKCSIAQTRKNVCPKTGHPCKRDDVK